MEAGLYYSTEIHALQKQIIRITVGAKYYKFILRWDIPTGVSNHRCVFIQLSITQQATCKRILATSFCSKSKPSPVHFTRTDKTEALYIIWMAITPFSLKDTL
jgi:hypothetical protein